MLRVVATALIILMFAVTAADARTKITVRKDVPRPIATYPYAVEFVLAAVLCRFAVMATPPGNPLPPCAIPHPAPTRRV